MQIGEIKGAQWSGGEQVLGSGTRLQAGDGHAILAVGDRDLIHIGQTGDSLHLTINLSERFQLTPRESSGLEVRAHPGQVTMDRAVTLPIRGLASPGVETAPGPEGPRAAAASAELCQALATHLAQLTSALGGPRSEPAVSSREQLVAPMRTLADTVRGGAMPPALAALFIELEAVLRRQIQRMTAGESPDMNPVGSLTTQLLSQMPRPGAPTKAPPPGMKYDEFVNKSKEIGQAISKGDIGAMRGIAGDPKKLACATAEQKGQMARALAAHSKAHGNEISSGFFGAGTDHGQDRNAINKILGSSASSEEFRTAVETAGLPNLREGLAPNPKDPKPDKISNDFDVMAGAFACPEMATNPEQAKVGQRAVEKGFSPQEIVEARGKISYTDSNKINPVPNDPLLSSVVGVEEKAEMIRVMRHHDFRNNDKADRTIANLAMTCRDKQEYDTLMAKAGPDVMSIEEKEAKGKVEKLAAGYGRTDLVKDPGALKYKDVLIDPAQRQKYLGGASEIERPRSVEQKGESFDDFKRASQERISAELERMDPLAVKETVFLNVEREAQGKKPLNPVELRKEAQHIAENKPPKSKDFFQDIKNEKYVEDGVDNLRKREGMSEYTARNLITQPCARAYEKEGGEAAGYLASQLGPLEEKLKRTDPFSPEAKVLRTQIDEIKKKVQPYVDHVNEVSGKFDKMYPPPSNPMEEVAKFFLAILENLGPALLNIIPGVGSLLYAGYQGVRAIISLAQGNFLGALGGLAGALPGVGAIIGGVAKGALGTAGSLIGRGAQAISAISRGDALGAVASVGGGLGALKGVGGTVGAVFGQAAKGIEAIGKGASAIQGIATGDFGKVASGLSGVVDHMGGLVKNNAEVGKIFHEIEKLAPPHSALGQVSNLFGRATQIGGALAGGDFERLHKGLSELKLPSGLPLGQDLLHYAQSGAALADYLKKGKVNEALDYLAKSKDPLLGGIGGVLRDGEKFMGGLVGGGLDRALNGAGRALAGFAGDQAIKDVGRRLADSFRLGQLASEVGSSPALLQAAQGGPRLLSDPSLAKAIEFATGSTKLIQDLASGDFRRGLGVLGDAAGRLLGSPEWGEASSLFRSGGSFLQALQSGRLEQALSQTPFDDPGLRSAAEQALGFTNLGRDFFSAIEHPTLAASLGSLIEQPHGMPDLVEAMRGTAGASSVFSALASGHFGNVLDDYESQLASLSRIGAPDSPLADFEQSAQRLADTGNLENEFLQNLVVLGKKRSATGSQMAIRAHLSERV